MLEFSLENLSEIDGGKAALAFQEHVRRATLDCMDRPGDVKKRTVTFKVEITPLMQDDGDCTEVVMRLHAASSVPPHQTRLLSLGIRRNGSLVFNPDSPNDVNQATLLPEGE